MTEQEILDSNVLIAEFVGGKFYQELSYLDRKEEVWVPHFGICRIDTIDVGKGKILEYHKSYDWLMPVVEKIESLNYKTSIISTLLLSGEMLYIMAITDNDDDITYWNERGNTKIEAVYNCVIAFIKWYNQNKENG
jgi:hypothetical protein